MHTKSVIYALLLSAIILFIGPIQPLFAYSSVDEGDEEYMADWFESDDADEPAPVTTVESKYEGKIGELNERIENIDKENERLNEEINNAKSEKERAQAEKNALDYQISLTREQIDAYMERIDLLLKNIVDKERSIIAKKQEVSDKQAEIDQNYEILKQRLRAKYMQNAVSTLGLVLGAESFSDLLTRIEYTRRIAIHDRNLLEELAVQRGVLEEQQRGLEADIQSLEAIKNNVESDKVNSEKQKEVLGVQVAKAQLQVQDMTEMERQFKADLEENRKAQRQMQAELERIFQQIEWDKNPYVGGDMLWPVPGYYNLSSYYGWRFSNTDYHTGVDIWGSGIHGQNVVAANAGTVRTTNWSYVPGKGYGIFVIIDHGGNVATLYAHLHNISVNVGDVVQQGDIIGNVGNTGWSTGPHLHFEIRLGQDQKSTNPLPYLQGGD